MCHTPYLTSHQLLLSPLLLAYFFFCFGADCWEPSEGLTLTRVDVLTPPSELLSSTTVNCLDCVLIFLGTLFFVPLERLPLCSLSSELPDPEDVYDWLPDTFDVLAACVGYTSVWANPLFLTRASRISTSVMLPHVLPKSTSLWISSHSSARKRFLFSEMRYKSKQKRMEAGINDKPSESKNDSSSAGREPPIDMIWVFPVLS